MLYFYMMCTYIHMHTVSKVAIPEQKTTSFSWFYNLLCSIMVAGIIHRICSSAVIRYKLPIKQLKKNALLYSLIVVYCCYTRAINRCLSWMLESFIVARFLSICEKLYLRFLKKKYRLIKYQLYTYCKYYNLHKVSSKRLDDKSLENMRQQILSLLCPKWYKIRSKKHSIKNTKKRQEFIFGKNRSAIVLKGKVMNEISKSSIICDLNSRKDIDGKKNKKKRKKASSVKSTHFPHKKNKKKKNVRKWKQNARSFHHQRRPKKKVNPVNKNMHLSSISKENEVETKANPALIIIEHNLDDDYVPEVIDTKIQSSNTECQMCCAKKNVKIAVKCKKQKHTEIKKQTIDKTKANPISSKYPKQRKIQSIDKNLHPKKEHKICGNLRKGRKPPQPHRHSPSISVMLNDAISRTSSMAYISPSSSFSPLSTTPASIFSFPSSENLQQNRWHKSNSVGNITEDTVEEGGWLPYSNAFHIPPRFRNSKKTSETPIIENTVEQNDWCEKRPAPPKRLPPSPPFITDIALENAVKCALNTTVNSAILLGSRIPNINISNRPPFLPFNFPLTPNNTPYSNSLPTIVDNTSPLCYNCNGNVCNHNTSPYAVINTTNITTDKIIINNAETNIDLQRQLSKLEKECKEQLQHLNCLFPGMPYNVNTCDFDSHTDG